MADQLYLEDMEPGLTRSFSRVVGDKEIEQFGALSGDRNPIHFDDAYAAGTRFGGRIAHGMLCAAFISKLLGMHLPGIGAVYLGQTLKFRAPVRPGDEVTVTGTVREVHRDRGRVTIDCECRVGDTVVVAGEATVLVPSRSA